MPSILQVYTENKENGCAILQPTEDSIPHDIDIHRLPGFTYRIISKVL